MPSLLAAIDGSPYADSVCDHAAWAAQRLSASVRVLHMLEPVPVTAYQTDFSGAIGVDAQHRLTEELVTLEQAKARVAQARAEAILASARARLTAAGLPPAQVRAEARHGALVDAIAGLDRDHDLVVIGKRGEHLDFAKGHLGSNLDRVIRSCRHPVLVTSRAFHPVQRALIAFDGSPSARKAIDYAVANPLLGGIYICLVHAGTPPAAVRLELDAAGVRLRESGHTVTILTPSGEPEKVIPEIIARDGVQLLAMGAYGHSRIRELIVGSTTTALIRTCQATVLLFR